MRGIEELLMSTGMAAGQANTLAYLFGEITGVPAPGPPGSVLGSDGTKIAFTRDLINLASVNVTQLDAVSANFSGVATAQTPLGKGPSTEITTAEWVVDFVQAQIAPLQDQITELAARQQYSGSANIGSPPGVIAATDRMMGFGLLLPMPSTGAVSRAIFEVVGQIDNTTNNGVTLATMYYGTGTPPGFGDLATGTAIGEVVRFSSASAAQGGQAAPFAAITLVGGLTLGTTYWFDMGVHVQNGTGSLDNVYATVTTLIDPVVLS
jgi:hypothetical protein